MTSASRTPWQVMAGNPLRFLSSTWPWRSLAYLLSGSLIGLTCMLVVVTLTYGGTELTLILIGMLLPALVLLGIPLARLERLRLRLLDPTPRTGGHRPPNKPGPVGWLRTRLGERATWREFTYTLMLLTVLWPIQLLVATGIPLLIGGLLVAAAATIVYPNTTATLLMFSLAGPRATVTAILLAVLIVFAGAYVVTGIAAVHAMIARVLLGSPKERLNAKAAEISSSRRRLVDAFDAERRRIERDLHDGAQERLVSLTMKLGIARIELDGSGSGYQGDAAALIADAHQDAQNALAELRNLIHGIHPRLLTDRGLPPALAELARRSPTPTHVDVHLPGRLPAAVESTAYFAVSQALTNIAEHANATRAHVRGHLTEGALVIEVEDNGVGGADPRAGTGLQGLADRAAVVDGALTLTSPHGGPTLLRLSIPATTAKSSVNPDAFSAKLTPGCENRRESP